MSQEIDIAGPQSTEQEELNADGERFLISSIEGRLTVRHVGDGRLNKPWEVRCDETPEDTARRYLNRRASKTLMAELRRERVLRNIRSITGD